MNSKLPTVLLALALGCASDEASVLDSQLDEASATWAKDKPGCSTYHYVRFTPAGEGSVSTMTSVEIANDHATRRRFVEQRIADNGQATTTAQWDETGPAVGTHDGFRAETVEELFADCRQVIAQDPKTNDLFLTVGTHGVPRDCVFVPKGCQDDCGMGFSLSDFACGPLP
jgi:hypothetical protein